jgi:hypothetical protein
MTEDAQGQVVTFYSYKGGTGRTMALANVAWILAANGLRVLVVDWDLESPGLARFFHPFLDDAALASTGGVTDLILEFEQATTLRTGRPEDWVRQHARVSKYALSLDWDFGNAGLSRRRPRPDRLQPAHRQPAVGRLLREARRRQVLRRAARGHEAHLRLHAHRQPHRPE